MAHLTNPVSQMVQARWGTGQYFPWTLCGSRQRRRRCTPSSRWASLLPRVCQQSRRRLDPCIQPRSIYFSLGKPVLTRDSTRREVSMYCPVVSQDGGVNGVMDAAVCCFKGGLEPVTALQTVVAEARTYTVGTHLITVGTGTLTVGM